MRGIRHHATLGALATGALGLAQLFHISYSTHYQQQIQNTSDGMFDCVCVVVCYGHYHAFVVCWEAFSQEIFRTEALLGLAAISVMSQLVGVYVSMYSGQHYTDLLFTVYG